MMTDKIELIKAQVRPYITIWLVMVWSLVTAFLVVAQVFGEYEVNINIIPNTPYGALTDITAVAFGWYYVKREVEKSKAGKT